MFWIGLIIGLFVGTMFGVIIVAMCVSAGDADKQMGVK
jgi:uncharacterized membrane-anchored protein YhcB (DUF1043 family)